MNKNLIWGKNNLERIVCIEPSDGSLEIFTENDSGEIKSQFLSNKYWILSNQKLNNNFVRLKGDLHYKWGIQFDLKEDFLKFRRIWRNNDIFSVYDSKEAAMLNKGLTYFKEMKPTDVSILSFDIETTGLNHNSDSKVLLISNTFRQNGKILKKLFSYSDYKEDHEMFDAWVNWVNDINPSIICGHNIYCYDLPYMEFCAEKSGTSISIGRDGSKLVFNDYESKFRVDGSRDLTYKKVRCYGRELIDTMFLAYKHDATLRKYESYGLKSIIKQEGLEAKDRTFYDASQIRYNYKDKIEWEKIKQYCIHDSDDALALFDLMAPAFFYTTQSIPKSFQSVIESASGSQINSIMVRSYLQEQHSIPKTTESTPYEGALSFGNPGVYKNVFKIDVVSMYPSLIIQHNVYDRDKDPDMNFLGLVNYFTEQRLKYKKLYKETKEKHYDDLQSAAKIFINSMYGFLAAPGLNFNSPHRASFITKKGRETLEKAINWANKRNFFIVNGDTDSISFCNSNFNPIDETERKQILEEINREFPKQIKFGDDGYFKTVIILKAKNYVLWDGKKIKYKGSAIKATTKEPALQQFIKDIIDELINETGNYINIYNQYVKEIMNIKDIKRWATRKTITEKVLDAKRTNEQKVLDVIEGSEIVEGDRIYTYFKNDCSLALVENFDGDYNKDKLLEKLYKTIEIFENVIDINLFLNYKLKRNKELLNDLI